MKGIILAAGKGSRLGTATECVPKPLLEVAGQRCIDFAVNALLAVVDEIVVVTGHMAEQVEVHLEARWRGSPLSTVRNRELNAGNLTSLGAARETIGNSPFIVTNADHLFPPEMYTAYFPPLTGVTIACERDRAILDDEMKVVVADGKLQAISKTLPSFDGAYIGTTSVGVDACAEYWRAFDAVATNEPIASASVEMVLARLAQDFGSAPNAVWIRGLRWFEVDTQDDLDLARGQIGR